MSSPPTPDFEVSGGFVYPTAQSVEAGPSSQRRQPPPPPRSDEADTEAPPDNTDATCAAPNGKNALASRPKKLPILKSGQRKKRLKIKKKNAEKATADAAYDPVSPASGAGNEEDTKHVYINVGEEVDAQDVAGEKGSDADESQDEYLVPSSLQGHGNKETRKSDGIIRTDGQHSEAPSELRTSAVSDGSLVKQNDYNRNSLGSPSTPAVETPGKESVEGASIDTGSCLTEFTNLIIYVYMLAVLVIALVFQLVEGDRTATTTIRLGLELVSLLSMTGSLCWMLKNGKLTSKNKHWPFDIFVLAIFGFGSLLFTAKKFVKESGCVRKPEPYTFGYAIQLAQLAVGFLHIAIQIVYITGLKVTDDRQHPWLQTCARFVCATNFVITVNMFVQLHREASHIYTQREKGQSDYCRKLDQDSKDKNETSVPLINIKFPVDCFDLGQPFYLLFEPFEPEYVMLSTLMLLDITFGRYGLGLFSGFLGEKEYRGFQVKRKNCSCLKLAKEGASELVQYLFFNGKLWRTILCVRCWKGAAKGTLRWLPCLREGRRIVQKVQREKWQVKNYVVQTIVAMCTSLLAGVVAILALFGITEHTSTNPEEKLTFGRTLLVYNVILCAMTLVSILFCLSGLKLLHYYHMIIVPGIKKLTFEEIIFASCTAAMVMKIVLSTYVDASSRVPFTEVSLCVPSHLAVPVRVFSILLEMLLLCNLILQNILAYSARRKDPRTQNSILLCSCFVYCTILNVLLFILGIMVAPYPDFFPFKNLSQVFSTIFITLTPFTQVYRLHAGLGFYHLYTDYGPFDDVMFKRHTITLRHH